MYKRMFTIAALTLLASSSFAQTSQGVSPASSTGSLDKDAIRPVIKQHMSEVKRCYEAELAKNPQLAGKVVVRFTIGSDGKVKASSVEESSLKNPACEKCIADSVLNWVFPKPRDGYVVVSYPFALASS